MASKSLIYVNGKHEQNIRTTLGDLHRITFERNSDDHYLVLKAAIDGYGSDIVYDTMVLFDDRWTGGTHTSYNFQTLLSHADASLYNTEVAVTYRLETWVKSNNSEETGIYGTMLGWDWLIVWCDIPETVIPSCSITVTDSEGLADTYGGYIQGVSKLDVTVNPTLAYGSPITRYGISANKEKYTSSTQNTYTTNVLESIGMNQIDAYVADKRGRISEIASEYIQVIPYSAPAITALSAHRCSSATDGTENDSGEFIQVKFSASVYSLNDKNTATYRLLYKKTDVEDYTPIDLTDLTGNYKPTDATYIFPAESGSSFDIEIEVTDSITINAGTKSTVVGTGFSLMHWKANGKGMGIGKKSEDDGVLDIGFATRFSGGIDGGALGIDLGGTGANTAEKALANLGGAALKDGLHKVVATDSGDVITASVPGITALDQESSFIMIYPFDSSRSEDSDPWELDVNGLGAKPIYRTTTTGYKADLLDLNADFPYLLTFSPSYDGWLAMNVPKPTDVPIPTRSAVQSALGFMSELWSGSWSSGEITVPNTSNYTLFQIRLDDGTAVLAMRCGANIQGVGGYRDTLGDSTLKSYQFSANILGNTWLWIGCNYALHATGSPAHTYADVDVVSIYGII